MNCPKCKQDTIIFEDHSSIGGPKEYWSCTNCSEEMEMFGK